MQIKIHEQEENKYEKVSVIIPTYNDDKYLENAIISVFHSSYPIYELIIIDDGSSTNYSQKLLESFIDKTNASLIYKRKENGGPSSARNIGISIAKGDWIVFLDADDSMTPDSIESKLNHLIYCRHNANIAGIYGSFIWSSSNKKQSFDVNYDPVSRNHVGIIGKVPGGAPSYIFKRKALIDIGGFDESLIFNEDFDLLLRLIKSDFQLVGINKPGFIRNMHEESLTRSSVFRSLGGGRRFLKKAFQNKLLDNHEITKRLILNYLMTFKQLLIYLSNSLFQKNKNKL
jgi:glycosyltransferase involved in cell wall biosynthesis